jgi:hypothetical protein
MKRQVAVRDQRPLNLGEPEALVRPVVERTSWMWLTVEGYRPRSGDNRMAGLLRLIVGPTKVLGDAARQPADRHAGGWPHLVQQRAHDAGPSGDAPQGAIGGALCRPLDDVGVPGRGRPAALEQVVLHRRIAQLPDDRPALDQRPTKGSAHALRHTVLAIHPGSG